MTRTIKLTLFSAANANGTKADNGNKAVELARGYLDSARKLLLPHGFKIDVLPAEPSDPPGFYLEGMLTPITCEEHFRLVRQMMHARYPHGNGRLPVLFSQILDHITATAKLPNGETKTFVMDEIKTCGLTISKKNMGQWNWLPYVIVNSLRHDGCDTTLAHEIGHASGLDHTTNSPGNLMEHGASAANTKLEKGQVNMLSKAYFTSG